ncbi:hypothetical protein ACFU7D_08475 [Nocardioides sp. NPDC057577]|uniref:hypothetical protein n=1 Tax=Nocardioides sp. NPDC057577 TaxID=3346171 RepID=UPI00366CB239
MSDQQRFDQAPSTSAQPAVNMPKRPLTIRLAVAGMCIGAALAGLGIIVAYVEKIAANQVIYADYGDNEALMDRLVQTGVWQTVGISAALAILEVALWLTMAVANWHGKKWARVVATSLGVVGLLLGVGDLVTSVIYEQVIVASVVHSIVTQMVSVAVLVLLWLPKSSSYYRSRVSDTDRP